jgi:hypothetical protein
MLQLKSFCAHLRTKVGNQRCDLGTQEATADIVLDEKKGGNVDDKVTTIHVLMRFCSPLSLSQALVAGEVKETVCFPAFLTSWVSTNPCAGTVAVRLCSTNIVKW